MVMKIIFIFQHTWSKFSSFYFSLLTISGERWFKSKREREREREREILVLGTNHNFLFLFKFFLYTFRFYMLMLFSNFSKLPIICELLKTRIPYKNYNEKIFQKLSKASTFSTFGTQYLFDLKTRMIQAHLLTCVFLYKFHHAIKKLSRFSSTNSTMPLTNFQGPTIKLFLPIYTNGSTK